MNANPRKRLRGRGGRRAVKGKGRSGKAKRRGKRGKHEEQPARAVTSGSCSLGVRRVTELRRAAEGADRPPLAFSHPPRPRASNPYPPPDSYPLPADPLHPRARSTARVYSATRRCGRIHTFRFAGAMRPKD